MKYTESEYNGHELPILINYKVIRHNLIYWKTILPMIIPIHITHSRTYPSVPVVWGSEFSQRLLLGVSEKATNPGI